MFSVSQSSWRNFYRRERWNADPLRAQTFALECSAHNFLYFLPKVELTSPLERILLSQVSAYGASRRYRKSIYGKAKYHFIEKMGFPVPFLRWCGGSRSVARRPLFQRTRTHCSCYFIVLLGFARDIFRGINKSLKKITGVL